MLILALPMIIGTQKWIPSNCLLLHIWSATGYSTARILTPWPRSGTANSSEPAFRRNGALTRWRSTPASTTRVAKTYIASIQAKILSTYLSTDCISLHLINGTCVERRAKISARRIDCRFGPGANKLESKAEDNSDDDDGKPMNDVFLFHKD
jgi:hypothetical protein